MQTQTHIKSAHYSVEFPLLPHLWHPQITRKVQKIHNTQPSNRSLLRKIKENLSANKTERKEGRGLKSLKILCTQRQLKGVKDATEGQDARLCLDTTGQALTSLSRHARLPQASLHLWASGNCPDVPELPYTQRHWKLPDLQQQTKIKHAGWQDSRREVNTTWRAFKRTSSTQQHYFKCP